MKYFSESLGAKNITILTIAISLSLVLVSISLLMYSVQNVSASPRQNHFVQLQSSIGLGCDGMYVYYFNPNGELRKMKKDIAREF
ncbi:hypothetical protein GCM10028816_51890 [Spirosoma lituiforme]